MNLSIEDQHRASRHGYGRAKPFRDLGVFFLVLGALASASSGCGNSSSMQGTGGSGGNVDNECSVLNEGGYCPSFDYYAAQCTQKGGVFETCNNATCSPVAPCGDACLPAPPAPTANEFDCLKVNCTKGQVCVSNLPPGDGCSDHSCMAPPAACTATPTCACLEAFLDPNFSSCTQDANGNATVSGVGVKYSLGG